MLDAKILGQLLLMQSILNNLPSKDSIFSFVCKGLLDIPGVKKVDYTIESIETSASDKASFLLERGDNFFGTITIEIGDFKLFDNYIPYIQNFMFMVEVILEERNQTELNKKHQKELEHKVEERTIELSKEISEKEKITQNLAQSENLFRTAFENATIGITLVQPNGNFMEVNNRFCQMLGYSREELLMLDFNSITHPDDKNIGSNVVKRILEGKENRAQFEKRYLTKSGQTINALVSSNILRDSNNNPEYFISHILDVSAEKKTQLELKRSEHKYRLLFENLTVAFMLQELVFDEKGDVVDIKYLDVNPAFEKITSSKATNLVGKLRNDLPRNIKLENADHLVEVAKSGIPIAYQYYWKSLDLHFDIWAFSPEKNKVAVLMNDITQRVKALKKLEKNEKILKEQNEEYLSVNEELQEKNEELATAIHKIEDSEVLLKQQNEEYLVLNEELSQANIELEKAKEHAEESDRLKSAFLANMSHEIRTPMNGILGFADLINDPDVSEGKRKYFSQIIKDSSVQLLTIVNDIIDISKIETGQISIKESDINLNDLLLEVFSFFKPASNKNNINLFLHKALPDVKSIIITDGPKLRQILNNLVSNALKFTHLGFVKFGYELKNNELEFFIEDTGIGIEKEQQELIFDRFQQAKHNEKLNFGGTGLGLAIAKAYVEKLGGKIWINSEPNQGSTFFFTIPYIKADDTQGTEDEKDDMQDLLPTILVVEDEEINYLYLEEVLMKLKVNVEHAKNGAEAISILDSGQKIDLVFMDIKLPDTNGYNLTREFKTKRPELPIIAQTAYAMSSDREKAINAGCIDYLSKPIMKEQLIQIVEEFFGKKD